MIEVEKIDDGGPVTYRIYNAANVDDYIEVPRRAYRAFIDGIKAGEFDDEEADA